MKERPIKVPLNKIKPISDKDGKLPGIDTSAIGKNRFDREGRIPGVDTSGVVNLIRFVTQSK